MLIPLTITARSKAERRTGRTIFNTDFMTEIQTHGGVARFKYIIGAENRKGSHEEFTVAETVAVIRTEINTALAATAVTLRVHEDEDPQSDTTYTVFNAPEIVMCWTVDPSDSGTIDGLAFKSYLLINEKGSLKRYLIDHPMEDVLSYAETASTSTYTTS